LRAQSYVDSYLTRKNQTVRDSSFRLLSSDRSVPKEVLQKSVFFSFTWGILAKFYNIVNIIFTRMIC